MLGRAGGGESFRGEWRRSGNLSVSAVTRAGSGLPSRTATPARAIRTSSATASLSAKGKNASKTLTAPAGLRADKPDRRRRHGRRCAAIDLTQAVLGTADHFLIRVLGRLAQRRYSHSPQSEEPS